MPAPTITLTTDLGYKDFYVPSVKGMLLSRLPAANIVDITHRIAPFNIAEASFILNGCFRDFPEGTMHLVSVDAGDNTEPRYLLARSREQYILTGDTGLISLMLESDEPDEMIELPYQPSDLVFPLKTILAPAACLLAEGLPLEIIGKPVRDYVRKAHLRPVLEETFVRGAVIYIDNMGNAITNIDRAHFNRYGQGRKFNIYISRREYFNNLNRHYTEVPEGEKVALFGAGGLLEIAINKGNGSELLGLKIGHPILVEFI